MKEMVRSASGLTLSFVREFKKQNGNFLLVPYTHMQTFAYLHTQTLAYLHTDTRIHTFVTELFTLMAGAFKASFLNILYRFATPVVVSSVIPLIPANNKSTEVLNSRKLASHELCENQ